MAMLEVRELAVRYGQIEAVQDASFDVNAGEVVALLGSNGAGKSTIMRTISGLKRSHHGSIRFGGRSIHRLNPSQVARLGIAQVAEGRRLFPEHTVEDNLLLGGYARKDRSSLREEMEVMYERWPVLRRRRREPAGNLSGGQQQMLAIAQALMASPRLLLMDEPSGGLDPLAVREVFQVIRDLQGQGITILLVEQIVEKALEVADRAYVLARGRIVLSGPAEELRSSSAVQEAYLGRQAARPGGGNGRP
jgi:branched-chain amino acid transport system ATP-binding protein